MTGALSPTHWLLILAVVLLLFGAKRLPDAARGMGRSLRIFKAETTALTDKDNHESVDEPAAANETDTPAVTPTAASPVAPSSVAPSSVAPSSVAPSSVAPSSVAPPAPVTPEPVTPSTGSGSARSADPAA